MIESRKPTIKGIFFISLCVLLLAAFSHFHTNSTPCILCKIQQGFYLGIFLLSLAWFLTSNRHQKNWLSTGIFSFIILGGIVAFYQLLLEFKILPDPMFCKTMVKNLSSTETLSQLLKPLQPTCSTPSWTFIGVSPAGWNTILSTFLTLLVLKTSHISESIPFKRA